MEILPKVKVTREISAFSADLILSVRNIFLLAAKPKDVAQKQARRVVMGEIEAGLLRFIIRKCRKAMGRAETEALEWLRIEIELGAFKSLLSEIAIHAERFAHLIAGKEALRSRICCGKRSISLPDNRRLSMNAPIVEVGEYPGF